MTSLYGISISVLSEIIETQRHVLDKSVAWAEEHEISEAQFLAERIYPNMLDLRLQVLIPLVLSRITIQKLSGKAIPAITPGSQTLAELYELNEETQRYLKDVKREEVDGKEDEEVTVEFFGEELRTSARDLVQKYTVPVSYFHLSTLYAKFRSMGVPLGKKDYTCVTMKDFKLVNP
ncbi:hypothetical protein BKA67DRAFT_214886 [Truncatella angustata]|uniref:Uncharacterized protein n=1 Tax=Truncatella angustata TaxID=152316 RepID=A0A9P9A1M4_9PEZI|nr:uncharacterized protein BKA67DRAFT_214886 [Truncatella angustata]KAH6658488.1 hypothetical protein BKA67DRAFT_214886 [Truncatella angustata]KAH8195273.1 hypothetical protein TruAng_010568 [Truncatella angustata]